MNKNTCNSVLGACYKMIELNEGFSQCRALDELKKAGEVIVKFGDQLKTFGENFEKFKKECSDNSTSGKVSQATSDLVKNGYAELLKEKKKLVIRQLNSHKNKNQLIAKGRQNALVHANRY